jgi:cytochrome P450
LWEYLKPKAVKVYSGKIREIIVEALDGLIAKGEGDAIADFAAKIPTRAMATVFGFSDEDAYRFDHDFGEVVAAASSNDPERQGRAVETFFAFLKEKLEDGRAGKAGGSIVASMLAYEKNGHPFNEDELLGLLWSTAGGAVDTTKHSIGHAIYNLGIRPDLRRKLIEEPRLLTLAVEENLRLDAPAFMTARHAVDDAEVGGVQIRAGERVLLAYGFGNHDESAFECPAEFRLDRKANNHLSFGHGIHTCVGMHLARMELKIALEEVLARMPDFELIEPVPEPKIRGGLMWAFDSLPIRAKGKVAE